VQTWDLPDGTRSKVCPRELITANTLVWFKWYRHYKNGLLPVTGGLLDQSAMYVEAMTVIEELM